jgi:glycerate kinase
MALVINDRVKETSTTTGTGAFTLDGAQTGFDTFALGIGGSNTTYYAIVNLEQVLPNGKLD